MKEITKPSKPTNKNECGSVWDRSSEDGLSQAWTDEEAATLTTNTTGGKFGKETKTILIGYAFGEKKMSTMGLVMAEASKAKTNVFYPSEGVKRDSDEVSAVGCGSGTTTSTSSSISNPVNGLQPIRVSFVPVDLDSPLIDQHGGNFDAILHKITEDILAASNLTPTDPIQHKTSIKKIKALTQYKSKHPLTALIDHPHNILNLMSRHHISSILHTHLRNVTTAHGLPVKPPPYLVLSDSTPPSIPHLRRIISEAPFTYPIIAKPLIAAGTAQSHQMLVLLNHHALDRIQTPSILQQYVNHDSDLYKVYVLGDKVWVTRRPSLPNLPPPHHPSLDDPRTSHVQFDSQLPYPHFPLEHSFFPPNKKQKTPPIDAEELRPVARVLRRAFGVEIFGFDVLKVKDSREILVIDVNYFPSYKEVEHFPGHFAEYLAKRVMEGRERRDGFKKSYDVNVCSDR